MSVEHVYRVSHSGWVHCHGGQAVEVPAWPRLKHRALVVLDLDDAPTDVWRFEGKPEYAPALIEKRVRTEGLVEGAAHIVIHRLVKVPRGFQAFFSAIPLELWQRATQWAHEQSDHCLVLSAAGLLCHGVTVGHARVMLSQRRLMCFAQTDAGMVFDATQALGQGPETMASAAQVLNAHQGELLARLGASAVDWVSLWVPQADDARTCLAALETQLGGPPVAWPATDLEGLGGHVHTALPALAQQAAGRHALNPLGERVAWQAERWVATLAVVTAVVGVGLVALGGVSAQQAGQQRTASAAAREELASLQARIQAVSTVETPRNLLPVVEFARQLDEGARYDPVAFLATLRASAGPDIRIQRVRLEGGGLTPARAFRVEGVAGWGASASVARWSVQMAAAGWSMKALDPTEATPGAFVYEMVAVATPSGT